MKRKFMKIALGILISSAVITSCKKDKVEENEEEVITTMALTMVPVGGGATLTYQFDDPDGPGGAAATIQEIILAPSKTYNVTIQLLNKTETPVADITLEVAAESADHRFYYELVGSPNLTISNLNNDSNGLPLGITSTWTTGAVSNGKVEVTLRHYPSGGKAGADPVNSSKSSTDISSSDAGGFIVKIQ